MHKLIYAGLGAIAAATVATAAWADDIMVATAGPMTGQYASFGEQMKNGAELAVEEINAAGGVNGNMLKLAVGDDACDPKQAVAVANKFVGDGVVFVAGHFCSGSSIPASAVYAEEGIVQISPASTNPKLTDERAGPGVYRVCGRDDQQGAVAGAYIADKFAGKKVAIIHDKTAYGKGLADETKKALNAAGMEEAMYEAYTAGEKDYTALVSKLKAEGIDVLYVGGYHTEAGLIVRQMREQGMSTQLISGDALVTDEYWGITGEAGAGTLMTFAPDPTKFAAAKAVVDKFKAKGINPEGYTLYTYAAMKIWADAANAAGSTDLEAITAKLNGTSYETVLGPIAFDAKGDVTEASYVWYVWKDGKYAEM